VRRHLAVVAVLAGLAVTACGSGASTGATSPSASSPSDAVAGPLTVFAASSLKEAFTRIGKDFEAVHPGVKVTFSFGASSTLATQITQKAPADVFASASQKTMDAVTSAGDATAGTVFAVNTMEIATPPNPTTPVASLADLGRPGMKVVVCQPEVPCGAAAQRLFTRNDVAVTPVSEEVDVKAVLTKVELGEADAGIVYVTDVLAAGDKVVGVAIPADRNVTTTYPIAPITASSNPAAARAFVDYVLSPAGQQVLTSAGFTSP
jgi:molybdate transport system substrate-binding protein